MKKIVAALIPARGGSKGVKLKNLYPLGGKPLISWTINSALREKIFHKIFVSSDNKKILGVAKKFNVSLHKRPKQFAKDFTTIFDTIINFYSYQKSLGYNIHILFVLEPTSPFRKKGLIKTCFRTLMNEGLDSIATFVKSRVHPYRIWSIENKKPKNYLNLKKSEVWKPRQKLSKTFELDGSIYAFRINKKFFKSKSLIFGKSKAYLLNKKDNFDLTGTEIDAKSDFELAEIALKKISKKTRKTYGF